NEGPALLEAGNQVILAHICLVVAGDVVCLVYEVCGADLVLSEAQVRYGDTARLLGVVGEIALGIEVGFITYNLYCALVGTNRSVGAESPELAADGAGILGNNPLIHRKRQIGYIVCYA